MSHRFPPELFNEIIGYLWNDIPSLKACSLSIRSMTSPSQKRLFYSICLRAPRERLTQNLELLENEIGGTSYAFWRLLVGSPHIAGYVQSLSVLDSSPSYGHLFWAPDVDSASSEDDQTDFGLLTEGYELANAESVVSKPALIRHVAQKTFNPTRRWLINDNYLPRCALLLHNVKAFILEYDDTWQNLSSKIQIALLRLMRLPSLLYVRLASHYPIALFNVAISDNVKHVVLHGCPTSVKLSILPQCPSSGPLYVDSLNIRHARGFPLGLFKGPNYRIETSRLRKITVLADLYGDHAAVWVILHTCRETLEDFEFKPSDEVMYMGCNSDDPIDLSKLTSLKRFAVHLRVSLDFDYSDDPEYIESAIPWFNRILQPRNTPPVGEQLEELSVTLFDYDQENVYLKDTFDILLDDRFKTLKKINISVGSELDEDIDLVDVLDSSEAVAKLRSHGDIVVNVRTCNILRFEPEVWWETVNWKR